MLNTFPHLLVLGFFAPTLLRAGAAALFIYGARSIYKHRKAAAHLKLPVVGATHWMGGFTAFAYAVIGVMLFFGAYTQVAAFLGAAASIKGLVLHKKFEALFPFAKSTYVLLLVVCLSLTISGAGALALDLPL